ncbi:hypothetical protein Bpfe_003038 [Biomphalaria pfeifferi]|uniref:Uncharacterized protein n=1 Tax=Biomphalaria pfeifferi TaxID=112525 RepID=A0AAD8C6Y8_BIOPF|nr:hypothetical protein Bpfe_003038 [Biomphalaria pfeifferi]
MLTSQQGQELRRAGEAEVKNICLPSNQRNDSSLFHSETVNSISIKRTSDSSLAVQDQIRSIEQIVLTNRKHKSQGERIESGGVKGDNSQRN